MSALIDAIAGGRGTVVQGLSVSFPGSTVRVSSAGATSVTGGHFTGKVLNWGSLNYQVSDRGGNLSAVETRVRIDDTDRTIARIYAGASADTVRGSAATIYLMTPTLASSSWFTLFSGVVVKVSFPSPFVAELTLRTNDDRLQRKSPLGGWTITRQTYPNADADVYGKVAPLVYGTHDASKFRTGPGMIPALYVDRTVFRYLISAGKCKTITRVYVDGVVTPTGWATEYVTRAGRIYTCINFTTDQGDAVITADVVGYEDVGDGSGTVISNPVTQWAHWLSNFVIGDYMTGAWAAHSSLIDSTTLTAMDTMATNIGAAGAVYAAERRTGIEITASLCKSLRLRTWWTFAGKVALGYDSPFVAAPYAGTRWRWYRDEMGPFSFVDDDFQRASRIVARSAFAGSDQDYLQSLEVVDASVTTDLQDTLDMPWSAAA